jgi:CheY-like chemotaxis protein
MSHPEALVEYNTPTLDSVTGAMRRKPLFCLPVLGCTSADVDSELETKKPAKGKDYGNTMQYMAESEVKNILVVDPNRLILDLFQRSLYILFPHASCVTATSGSDALDRISHLLAAEQRPYDIIIAEERLQLPLERSPILRSHTMRNKVVNGKHVIRKSASEVYGPDAISGSELFQRILQIERDAVRSTSGDIKRKDSKEASTMIPRQPGSLLIGVSCNESDSKLLLESGADLLWGKPPPCMNNALRNQMVVALVEKRKSL